jgi:mannose-6-phosphate isomerase-like protein (cupin superfamily)
VWHDLKYTDEVFVVLEGEITIHFPNDDVSAREGEMIVIPKGENNGY